METSYDKESRTRSLLKAITWRIIGTLDTILLSWLLTGRFVLAISIGGAELLTKTVLFYLHERAWQLLPRGTVRRWVRITARPNRVESTATHQVVQHSAGK